MSNEIPTRNEADKLRQAKIEAAAKPFREKVATALREGTRRPVTIATKGVTREALTQVINELRSKGWSVDQVPDQRDGDYLKID